MKTRITHFEAKEGAAYQARLALHANKHTMKIAHICNAIGAANHMEPGNEKHQALRYMFKSLNHTRAALRQRASVKVAA